MKPHLKLDEARTPDGARLTLHAHDGRFSIRINGQELMHSAVTTSEAQLGEMAVARLAPGAHPRVLIGGLGMGFTLAAVLSNVGPGAKVDVAELVPQVVEWNRTHMEKLNGWRLADARVSILREDVGAVLSRTPARTYDAVILDVDNGPTAMVHGDNARLYGVDGIQTMVKILTPGGRMAVWSAGADSRFEARLTRAGLRVSVVPAKLHATARRATYVLYFADKQPW